jgi:hypothetical protein
MNRNFKKLSLLLTSCGVVALGAGCSGPGTTNNDQGIAVTHLGFFSALTTSCTTLPAGVAGFSLQMSTAKPEPNSTLDNGSLAGVDGGSNLVAVVGVQNNLFRQAFRADRVIYDYFIAGASIQPPSTNVAINLLAGPGSAATGGTTGGGAGGGATTDPTNGGRNPVGSSLPPSFAGLCNRAFAQAYVIPASIREWINFNRDSLPEPPFMLEVTARISGLSTSGDRFETQPASLPVSVVDEILITPTEGDGGDTGADGLTDDGSSEESTTDASLTDGEGGDSSDVTGLEDVISDAQNGDSEGVSTDL